MYELHEHECQAQQLYITSHLSTSKTRTVAELRGETSTFLVCLQPALPLTSILQASRVRESSRGNAWECFTHSRTYMFNFITWKFGLNVILLNEFLPAGWLHAAREKLCIGLAFSEMILILITFQDDFTSIKQNLVHNHCVHKGHNTTTQCKFINVKSAALRIGQKRDGFQNGSET